MRKIVGEKKKTQRNRFTRMCMGDALVNIMQQKAYDKISVSDIVKKAGVSRMTYYNYYGTKDELVKDYIEEITSLYLEEEKNNLKEKNTTINSQLNTIENELGRNGDGSNFLLTIIIIPNLILFVY